MKHIIIRVGRWPIAGLVASLIFFFDIWSSQIWFLGFAEVWPTLCVVASITLITTALLRFIYGDWARAGVATSLLILFLFFVPVAQAILGVHLLGVNLLALVQVGVVISFILIWRELMEESTENEAFVGWLNLFLIGLLIWSAMPLAQLINLEEQRTRASSTFYDLQGRAIATSPDVWHLIFDRYASFDILKKVYGFDNTPFLNALRQRGFFVREEAFSNYPITTHSVASTLNANSLDSLKTVAHPKDFKPLFNALADSAAMRLFNRMGYRTIFLGSSWEPTRYSRAASESINIRALPQIALLLLNRSYFGLLFGWGIPWFDSRVDQCFRANEMFKKLGELAHSSERKYIFAHFLVPHPPFVLNADGSCRPLDLSISATRTANYIAEIQFINSRVLPLVDAIISGPRPAVIVIHSDEGPYPAAYAGKELFFGEDLRKDFPWSSAPANDIIEKMGILFAFRDPSGLRPHTIPESSVQIYPSLLRDHFGSKQAMPQSFYRVFSGYDALYNFVDVSDRLGVR